MARVDLQDLVEAYRLALLSAGYNPQVLAPGRGHRRPTHSREAFEAFACLKAAPQVMAVLAKFSDVSGLRSASDFSVSCIPSTGWSAQSIRACTVSVGMVEVLYVVLDRSTGDVAKVVLFGVSDTQLSWLSEDRALDEGAIEVFESDLDGGGTGVAVTGRLALEVLRQPEAGGFTTERVRALRARARRARREDWHNQWLWAAVDSGVVASPETIRSETGVWDVSSEDALKLFRQRTSQQAFRRLLIDQGPLECAICGLALLEVLEAVHLIPHARGGKASSENGRLLCANHHRAFDARLYEWTGSRFAWVGQGDEPALGRQEHH